MKKINILSVVLGLALTVSCQPKDDIIDSPIQNTPDASVVHTFICEFAQPDSKFAVASDGKTSWEVGDEIMLHGGDNGASRLKITLGAEDISADGKQATISFTDAELPPYDRSDANVKSKYYAQYPASSVPSGNMYYECCFTETNNVLMAACDVGNTFVFYNLCSIVSYTVDGEFDKVVFFGNNGERVGYDYYQVRIRNDESGMVVNYHKPGNGFTSYNEWKIIEDDSIVADGSTVNYLCFPNGANFSKGFTFIFYKNGNPQKTVSTKTAVNLAINDLLPLGNLSSHLKDYVPTYTVVGDNTSVFGSSWNTFAAENVMTDNGDGTYSITYNVPACTLNFKVVKDHSYDYGQWPLSGNQEYVANAAGALTIIFNPNTNAFSFNFVEAATYTVAGTANLFGSNWDETDTNNDMILQTDGTYVWKKDVSSAIKNIEFKIVKNHSWGTAGENNWPDGPNETYSVPAAGTVYIYFNPADKVITKVFKAKVTIDGDMSEWAYISGVTGSNSIYLEFKASYDEDNLYFYSKRNWQTNLWAPGSGAAYIYYYIVDSDSSTGSTHEYVSGVTGIDGYFYLHLYNGSSDSPDFYADKKGGRSGLFSTYSNVTVGGYTDKSTVVETEICIPRSDAGVVSGGTYKFYTYGSKDAGNMGEQYISLTLND